MWNAISLVQDLKMYKIAEKVMKFIEENTKNRRGELIAGEKKFAEVKIQIYSREMRYRQFYL